MKKVIKLLYMATIILSSTISSTMFNCCRSNAVLDSSEIKKQAAREETTENYTLAQNSATICQLKPKSSNLDKEETISLLRKNQEILHRQLNRGKISTSIELRLTQLYITKLSNS